MAGARKVAETWQDYRMVENVQECRRGEMLKDVHSFDAVCDLRKESDKHNRYWIYRVN